MTSYDVTTAFHLLSGTLQHEHRLFVVVFLWLVCIVVKHCEIGTGLLYYYVGNINITQLIISWSLMIAFQARKRITLHVMMTQKVFGNLRILSRKKPPCLCKCKWQIKITSIYFQFNLFQIERWSLNEVFKIGSFKPNLKCFRRILSENNILPSDLLSLY